VRYSFLITLIKRKKLNDDFCFEVDIRKDNGGISEAELLQACSSVNADFGRLSSHGIQENNKSVNDRYSGYNKSCL